MKALQNFFSNLWKDESAELTVEYGLLVAVLALGLVAVFTLFRQGLTTWFTGIINTIQGLPPA